MPRTTIDIDAPILRDLKRRQKRKANRSAAWSRTSSPKRCIGIELNRWVHRHFRWIARSMRAQIDLADKSLYQNLNGQGRPISGREGDRPTPALKKPLAVARGVNDLPLSRERRARSSIHNDLAAARRMQRRVSQPSCPKQIRSLAIRKYDLIVG